MTLPEDTVLVPALVGLTVTDAHALALDARLVLANADPARPLPMAGVVTDQEPAAGLKAAPADTVLVVVDEGGHDRAPVAPLGDELPDPAEAARLSRTAWRLRPLADEVVVAELDRAITALIQQRLDERLPRLLDPPPPA